MSDTAGTELHYDGSAVFDGSAAFFCLAAFALFDGSIPYSGMLTYSAIQQEQSDQPDGPIVTLDFLYNGLAIHDGQHQYIEHRGS